MAKVKEEHFGIARKIVSNKIGRASCRERV